MALTLTPRTRTARPGRIALRGTRVAIGRGPDVDLFIDDASVEPEHAVVRLDGDAWVIEASGACASGGVPLARGEPRLLQHGVALLIGNAVIDCTDEDTVGPGAKHTIDLAIGAVAHGMRVGTSPDRWAVRVLQGKDRGVAAVIAPGSVMTIGRADGLGLSLVDPTVSREHVALRVQGEQLQVRDLEATQGTFLGAARIEPRRWAVWRKDVALRIGDVVLACVPPMSHVIAERTAAVPVEGPTPSPRPLDEPLPGDPVIEAATDPHGTRSALDEPTDVTPEKSAPNPVSPKVAPIVAAPRGSTERREPPQAFAVYIAGGALLILVVSALVWILRGG